MDPTSKDGAAASSAVLSAVGRERFASLKQSRWRECVTTRDVARIVFDEELVHVLFGIDVHKHNIAWAAVEDFNVGEDVGREGLGADDDEGLAVGEPRDGAAALSSSTIRPMSGANDVMALLRLASSTVLWRACRFSLLPAFRTDMAKRRDDRIGAVYVYSTVTLSPAPVKVVRLHASPVTALAYNRRWNCAVSADSGGVLELWDGTVLGSSGLLMAGGAGKGADGADEGEGSEESAAYASIGSSPISARNGTSFSSKFDTDLYALVKKRTCAVSLCVNPTGTHFAVYGRDRKVRVYDWSTCKIAVTFDEREKVYDAMVTKNAERMRRGESSAGGGSSLDAVEYGKRAATERELDDMPVFSGGIESDDILVRDSGSQLIAIDFDPTGKYLLLPTLLGIKVIDWRRRKSACPVIGRADAAGSAGLRFLSATVCGGDAVIDRQMELARTGGVLVHSKVSETEPCRFAFYLLGCRFCPCPFRCRIIVRNVDVAFSINITQQRLVTQVSQD